MNSDFDRVIFVPVIHTDAESVQRVRNTIREHRPDVVAVELDRQRYELMLNPPEEQASVEAIPTGDMVQNLMQQFALLEKNLGDMVGSDAGAEMMAAIEEGKAIGAKTALIDRPIQVTMQALMQVPLDELYRMAGMIPELTDDEEGEDATEIMESLKEEEGVSEIMSQFRKEFPNISRALIDERDEYIARALKTILGDVDGKIVAVLGAGHIEGVKKRLRTLLQQESAS
ncbi:MAG: TraB domain-containing protein [Candidatus Thorarchaeota archaeon]|nr:TraB domain-containing protein [Candidatus Thorarchaeota archaeon]